MLATLSPSIVEGLEWVFEEKYDGIRAVAGRERGHVKIWSRMLQDLTGGFPHIVAAVEALGGGDLTIDGELVALDATGVSRFQLLQRRGTAGATTMRYAIFDLLEQDGRSLMSRPLSERRAALERLIGGGPLRSLSGDGLFATERRPIARPSVAVGKGSSPKTSARRTSPGSARPSGAR